MKKFFSKFLLIIILFLIYILIHCKLYANSTFNELSQNIFRFHIIAKTDTKKDQQLKLKIRDEIIKYLNSKTKNCKTKKEVIEITSLNITKLQEIAVKTIKDNNFDYNVTLEIGNFYFPTKYYGNISMPARKI